MRNIIEGFFTRADQVKSRYAYLPVDVPAKTERLEVRLRYAEGNVLDLGIADPRFEPERFPNEQGFRGWSGGFRDRFVITSDAATPGYLPGPLFEGTWHVLLGLHKLAPEGCSYRLELLFNEPSDTLALPLPLFSAVPDTSAFEPGWYPGDLHAHSYHSDAAGSLEDLVMAARARGLTFLAVTDHNTVGHHPHLRARSDLLLIPGQEVTTDFGHMNVWGASHWVDFRVGREANVGALLEQAHTLGGVTSVNHPKEGGPRWTFDVPAGVHALEAWQSPWFNRNWESLALYQALLRAGRRITLVGGSDRHQPGFPDPDPEVLQLGSPTTWLYLKELSVEAALEALKHGRVFVSESPSGPRLMLSAAGREPGDAVGARETPVIPVTATVKGAEGDVLALVGRSGVLCQHAVLSSPFTLSENVSTDEYFVRAEVLASADRRAAWLKRLEEAYNEGRLPTRLHPDDVAAHPFRRALSNPIYLKPG